MAEDECEQGGQAELGGTGDSFAHERGGDAALLVCRADVDAYLGGSVPGGALAEGTERKPASQCALVFADPKWME